MNDKEELFVRSLSELRDRLSRQDRYDHLKACGILRLLLLDSSPLIHQVNARYRFKIRFQTINFRIELPIEPLLHWTTLDAGPVPGVKTIEVTLDELLGAKLVAFKGHTFSVRDVISTGANIRGGVHAGMAKNPRELVLLELEAHLKIDGLDASLAALRSVTRVVLLGLEPLETAVQEC